MNDPIQFNLTEESKQFLRDLLQDKEQLDRIEHKLDRLLRMELKEMSKIDDVVADIADLGTVEDSLVALFNAQKEELKNQGLDAAKVDAAFSALEARKKVIADALVASTPNATPPTV